MDWISKRNLTLTIAFSFMGFFFACRKLPIHDQEITKSSAVDRNRDNSPMTEGSEDLPVEIRIRAPGGDVSFPAPTIPWLTSGPWKVTYSTLPMWKENRNVQITYKLLEPDGETQRLDDLVEYQPLDSDRIKTVHGVDKASPEGRGWAWDWRGSGLLIIASSHWEVLGYGAFEAAEGKEIDWAVTYFAKTLFSPAGIDIYSRPGTTVPENLVDEIKKQLKGAGNAEVSALVDELFLVKHDR